MQLKIFNTISGMWEGGTGLSGESWAGGQEMACK